MRLKISTAGLCFLIFFIEILLEAGRGLASSAGSSLSFRNIFIYGALFFCICQMVAGKKNFLPKRFRNILFLFSIIVVYATLSMAMPQMLDLDKYNVMGAIAGLKNDIFDGIVILFISNHFLKSEQHINWLIIAMLVVIGAGSALTFLDTTIFHGKVFGLLENSSRPKGLLGEPNQTATVLALFFPVTLAFIASNQQRIINIGVAGAMVLALLATGSRGGMVGYLIGAASILYIMRSTITLPKRLAIILLAVGMICLAWLVLPDLYREQIAERLGIFTSETATARDMSAGRTIVWDYVLKMWELSPVLGTGWYGFLSIGGVATHNLYLEYLVGIGLLGLGIYLYAWFQFVRYFLLTSTFGSAKQRAPLQGIVAGCLALLAGLMFVNLYKPWLVVWTFLGPLSALCNLRFKERLRNIRAKATNMDGGIVKQITLAATPTTTVVPPEKS